MRKIRSNREGGIEELFKKELIPTKRENKVIEIEVNIKRENQC